MRRLRLGTRRAPHSHLHLGQRALALQVAHQDAVARRYPLAQPGLDGAGLPALNLVVQQALAAAGTAPLAVQLGCAWSHLLLLPWAEALNNEKRWLSWARARFEQLGALDADAWSIHVGCDAPGRERIAAAWPQALRAALVGARQVHSVRIGLLQSLSQLLRAEAEFSGCLLELDGDCAAAVLILDGQPRRVRRAHFADIAGLSATLRAEWARVLAAYAAAGARPAQPGLALMDAPGAEHRPGADSPMAAASSSAADGAVLGGAPGAALGAAPGAPASALSGARSAARDDEPREIPSAALARALGFERVFFLPLWV